MSDPKFKKGDVVLAVALPGDRITAWEIIGDALVFEGRLRYDIYLNNPAPYRNGHACAYESELTSVNDVMKYHYKLVGEDLIRRNCWRVEEETNS